jgi:Icc-related predicted phosphoesterase
MKIVAISDTHCQLQKIAEKYPMTGDLLVHAGDLTYRGDLKEMPSQLYDLGQLGKKFKHGAVFICGNHDWLGEREPGILQALAEENGIVWLQDQEITIGGVRIWGSAYTPAFCQWAFQTDPYGEEGPDPEEVWSKVPEGVDLLLTHGPSFGHLDTPGGQSNHVGCPYLMRHIQRIKPKIQVSGHIHGSHGHVLGADGILYVNASICNENYDPNNKPVVIDYADGIATVVDS